MATARVLDPLALPHSDFELSTVLRLYVDRSIRKNTNPGRAVYCRWSYIPSVWLCVFRLGPLNSSRILYAQIFYRHHPLDYVKTHTLHAVLPFAHRALGGHHGCAS